MGWREGGEGGEGGREREERSTITANAGHLGYYMSNRVKFSRDGGSAAFS